MQPDTFHCHCGFSTDMQHLWAGHMMRCNEALEVGQERVVTREGNEHFGHTLKILGRKKARGYHVDRRGGRIYTWIVQCQTCFGWGEHRGDSIVEQTRESSAR